MLFQTPKYSTRIFFAPARVFTFDLRNFQFPVRTKTTPLPRVTQVSFNRPDSMGDAGTSQLLYWHTLPSLHVAITLGRQILIDWPSCLIPIEVKTRRTKGGGVYNKQAFRQMGTYVREVFVAQPNR